MLRPFAELKGFGIRAADGEIGSVVDLYLDDQTWDVRYVVVDTGGWLFGRKVLLFPASFGFPDEAAASLPTSLTRDQIRNSPDVDTQKPVGREEEEALHLFYHRPLYWGGSSPSSVHDLGLGPEAVASGVREGEDPPFLDGARRMGSSGGPHLRSGAEFLGCTLESIDGPVGHVEDILIDDDAWRVSWLLAHVEDGIPPRRALVKPEQIVEIQHVERHVVLPLPREALVNAPDYEPTRGIDPTLEQRLEDHYRRFQSGLAG